MIYAATVIGIVAVDLLTGILVGLALSVLKVVYARTHLSIRCETNPNHGRADVYLSGAATFLRLPQLVDALERVPAEYETHVHFRDLDYVDDAGLQALSTWQNQRVQNGSKVILEWGEALRLYRDNNPLGSYQRADVQAAVSSH